MHKKITLKLTAFLFLVLSFGANAQNALLIPDTLTGPVYNLNVQTGIEQFIGTNNTPTLGYNGNFLGPTLIINQGDSITLNVTNNITQATTVHWHGFHVAPQNDGGPHQSIAVGDTWSPSFKMRNEAATFWYHPHGEGKTEIQVSKGLAGLIIVRDTVEDNYILPRKYGIDDFPLIVQSKAFDVLYQIATATHEDSINMVNGTVDPYLDVPQQVVRFRLLNGSADRTYYFGLSDNSNFNLIASDGGLLSAPFSTNRLRLSSGERAEILVDFGAYTTGTQIYLKSYASELPYGIIGADSVGTSTIIMAEGYYTNPLNGADFNVLRFDVGVPTTSPVLTIPLAFAPKIPLLEASAVQTRNIHFSADTVISGPQGFVDGPFFMNNVAFNMDSINIVIQKNDVEIWELTNSTMVAHPFHIHDIEFYVLDINGVPPPPQYQGLKDVILVKPNDTVRFITQFTTFSNFFVPYMFHCHLLHHEDEGMMGAFLVVDSATIGIKETNKENNIVSIYPNPSNDYVEIKLKALNENAEVSIYNLDGKLLINNKKFKESILLDMRLWPSGGYVVEIKMKGKLTYNKLIKL